MHVYLVIGQSHVEL